MSVKHAVTIQDKYSHRYRIHQRLIKSLDLEELRTLCFYLGVDYDNLQGEGKAAEARELIKHQERIEAVPRINALLESHPWLRGNL
jgi:hypothetical protein